MASTSERRGSNDLTNEGEKRRKSVSDLTKECNEETVCPTDRSWELRRKHVFILSSSGKPIYCNSGDEQELVTIFGLLQAVVSIVNDSGDSLKCK